MNFKVSRCDRSEIKDFIEKFHYSHNINGVKGTYYFKLEDGDKMIGALFYGNLAMRNQYKAYTSDESEIIELRRLVCVDDTPKNTESYFIGKTLKWLEKNTSLRFVLSYADQTYGHTGVIYQASNFKLMGQTSPGKVIMWNGKSYHDHTIRTKYKGRLKPFAQRVKDALERGEAFYTNTLGKMIYLYNLRNRLDRCG